MASQSPVLFPGSRFVNCAEKSYPYRRIPLGLAPAVAPALPEPPAAEVPLVEPPPPPEQAAAIAVAATPIVSRRIRRPRRWGTLGTRAASNLASDMLEFPLKAKT